LKPIPGSSAEGDSAAVLVLAALDLIIPRVALGLLLLGVVLSAMQHWNLADYIFVAGLLYHLAVEFDKWWSRR
jgi:hypothetical protein